MFLLERSADEEERTLALTSGINSEMKFFVHIIIVMAYVFNLFHVVTVVYNGRIKIFKREVKLILIQNSFYSLQEYYNFNSF
jgi:hypothetical protein